MDAIRKPRKNTGEISMVGNPERESHVIIDIPGDEKHSEYAIPDNSKDENFKVSADSYPGLLKDSTFAAKNKSVSFSSLETASVKSQPSRVPRSETFTRRKSLSRSAYSKLKSRFGEPSVSIDSQMFDEVESLVESQYAERDTNTNSASTIKAFSRTPKGALIGGVDEDEDEDEDADEEIYNKVSNRRTLKYREVKAKAFIEWLIFLTIFGCLIASVSVDKFQKQRFWGLRIWKWFVLVLVTFSGLLITQWLMRLIVFFIELNYLLKKKMLYFIYGLKTNVRVCIWLALVLLTWIVLFQGGVKKKPHVAPILHFITFTVAALLIGSVLWLLKTLLLMILASSFHVNTFFDRIQESIFHQYILLTLSGPPVIESGEINNKYGRFSFRVVKKGREDNEMEEEKKVIDIYKLHRLKQEKVSAWTMKMLVDLISNSGLTMLSKAVDESAHGGGNARTDKEITNEEEAIAAAYLLFRNVAQPGCKYIDAYDLGKFMVKEEVDFVFPMIDVAETGEIDRKMLTDWVVKVYKGRKALAHALNDTKTAVKQLDKLITVILIAIIIIVWLLLTGIATTKVLVFLSSQLVVAVFIFGNTCKMLFEAIIFVFVLHPFDVGDRCVIDGVEMIVEEMNILSTVFLKFDNEKIYFPNSVLATKPISNFYRSPDMGDSLDFCIDFKTPMEKIGTLRAKIKRYLEKNPQHWYPNHNIVVKEIESVSKIRMAVFVNHTINFQDFTEKCRRKTNLVLEMKNILDDLDIIYDLLPQNDDLVDPPVKR